MKSGLVTFVFLSLLALKVSATCQLTTPQPTLSLLLGGPTSLTVSAINCAPGQYQVSTSSSNSGPLKTSTGNTEAYSIVKGVGLTGGSGSQSTNTNLGTLTVGSTGSAAFTANISPSTVSKLQAGTYSDILVVGVSGGTTNATLLVLELSLVVVPVCAINVSNLPQATDLGVSLLSGSPVTIPMTFACNITQGTLSAQAANGYFKSNNTANLARPTYSLKLNSSGGTTGSISSQSLMSMQVLGQINTTNSSIVSNLVLTPTKASPSLLSDTYLESIVLTVTTP